MQFNETGLPYSPTVYTAFMIFTKLQQYIPPQKQRQILDATQLLNEHTNGRDADLLAIALLQSADSRLLPLLKQRLGDTFTNLYQEIEELQKTKFSGLMGASNNVKLLLLANFTTGMQMMEDAIVAQIEQTGSAPRLAVTGFNDIQDSIAVILGTTSCPALEEKCYALSQEISQYIVTDMTSAPAQTSPYPKFTEAQLLDDDDVQKAYSFITHLPDANPEEVHLAIRAAQLLSDVPAQPNPVEVAAALLQYGYHQYQPHHIQHFNGMVSADVMKILSQGKNFTHPGALAKAMPETKRIVLAAAIAQIEGIEAVIPTIEQRKASNPAFGPAVEQSLNYLKDVIKQVNDITAPVLNQSGSPRLETMYTDLYRDTLRRIQDNLGNPVHKKSPPSGPQV